MYCGMEDLSVNGSLLASGTNIGVQLTQMQKGWLRNVIIEGFAVAGNVGLYLRGSTAVGVGSAAAPHTWRCAFYNVVVATTVRPLVLENADECDFYNCNFGLPTGKSSAVIAAEFIQGHNQRFFGLLLSGDTNTMFRPNYIGLKFNDPTKGDNSGHQVYGLVAEGFDIGAVVGSAVVQSIWIRGYSPSLSRGAFNNGGPDDPNAERTNNVTIELANSPGAGSNLQHYSSAHRDDPEALTFPNNVAMPSVQGGNCFAFSNAGATTVTKFLNGRRGRLIVVRLDANTTLQHGTGTDNIRCPGGVNIGPAAHRMVTLQYIAGIWETVSVSTN